MYLLGGHCSVPILGNLLTWGVPPPGMALHEPLSSVHASYLQSATPSLLLLHNACLQTSDLPGPCPESPHTPLVPRQLHFPKRAEGKREPFLLNIQIAFQISQKHQTGNE